MSAVRALATLDEIMNETVPDEPLFANLKDDDPALLSNETGSA